MCFDQLPKENRCLLVFGLFSDRIETIRVNNLYKGSERLLDLLQ